MDSDDKILSFASPEFREQTKPGPANGNPPDLPDWVFETLGIEKIGNDDEHDDHYYVQKGIQFCLFGQNDLYPPVNLDHPQSEHVLQNLRDSLQDPVQLARLIVVVHHQFSPTQLEDVFAKVLAVDQTHPDAKFCQSVILMAIRLWK